jgi:hypothetical protein
MITGKLSALDASCSRMDSFVSQARDARIASIQVSIALGLTRREANGDRDCEELDITKQTISRRVAKFLRISGAAIPGWFDPAFGLKNPEVAHERRSIQGIVKIRSTESKNSRQCGNLADAT